MKRALVMMDMSGLGRCALAVALPVLSAMGVQAVPLPVALLSAHTGGFGKVERIGLTDYAGGALGHYERLGERFDAVYAGYMISDDQLNLLGRAIDAQPGAMVLIDPVMADHGKFYRGIGPGRAGMYRGLIGRADLVTPNLTEARLLTGMDEAAPAHALLQGLLDMGCAAALITGAVTPTGTPINAYMRRGGTMVAVPYARAEGSYPGTGDLFASVLLGALLGGADAERAIGRAADFVRRAVELTHAEGSPVREGVRFERLIGQLIPSQIVNSSIRRADFSSSQSLEPQE